MITAASRRYLTIGFIAGRKSQARLRARKHQWGRRLLPVVRRHPATV